MLRYCGALTQVTGQSTVFVNGVLAAVEGDKDTHEDGGSLIQRYGGGNIFINGKKLIVSMGDTAAPDSENGIIHPFSPTDPFQGNAQVIAYGGLAGGGTGQTVGDTGLNIGENVTINGTPVGLVKNIIEGENGQLQVILHNMKNLNFTPQAGQTLVGVESGGSVYLNSFVRSNAYDLQNTAPDYSSVLNTAVSDDTGVVMSEDDAGKISTIYNSNYVVVSE